MTFSFWLLAVDFTGRGFFDLESAVGFGDIIVNLMKTCDDELFYKQFYNYINELYRK